MFDRTFGILQRMGRSFMLPIAILPVAGLLMGIGTTFTNEITLEMYHLDQWMGDGTALNALFTIMKDAGQTVFTNIAVIFAIGVAIGMTKKDRETAALAAFLAYMVMNTTMSALLVHDGQILSDGTIIGNLGEGTVASVCGIWTLQTGVFGGIIVGMGVACLHNRFREIEFPQVFAFFGGQRFVPIISILVYMAVGVLMYYVWPFFQLWCSNLGTLVTGTGYLGTMIFGVVKRALIPLGLHHVFYLPFWQTAVGGTMEIGGTVYEGGQNIFFAQLADPDTVKFSADACRYFSGEVIFMIFGLPGAALAMYHCARPERKKEVGSMLLSAALTSMLTGITEPLEFSFLFAAPVLFGVQVILAGSCYMVAQMLDITIGLTFSGGLLDFITLGVMQGNAKTNWILVIPVGMIYFFLYYTSFRFLILRFDLKTPGREEEKISIVPLTPEEWKLDGKPSGDGGSMLEILLKGLGGGENIEAVDCCATRLRCSVRDEKKINEDLLNRTGHSGMLLRGRNIQIIYGPQVSVIKSRLEDCISSQAGSALQPGDMVKPVPQRDIGYKFSPEIKEENRKLSADRARIVGRAGEPAQKKTPPDEPPEIIPQAVCAPAEGKVLKLSEVDDLIFSSELLGKGFAIIPEEGRIYAPLDGVIGEIFDTNHAVAIRGTKGANILIHVGLDTASLKGKYFENHVAAGSKVKKGDLLLSFDMAQIREAGYEIVTPVVVSNTDLYAEVTEPEKEYARMGEEVIFLR